MKAIIAAISVMLIYSGSVMAATEVSKDDIKNLGLVKIGTVRQSDTNESVTCPMELEAALSKKADSIGGKYYLIIAAREVGPNFKAIADVYK